MRDPSQRVLKSQRKTLFLGILVACLMGWAFLYLLSDETPKTSPIQNKVDLPGDKINAQEIWMTRVEGEGKLLEQKLKYLESIILDSKKKEAEKDQENQQLRNELARFKYEVTSGLRQQAQREVALADDPFSVTSIDPLFSLRLPLQSVVMGKATRNVSHVDQAIPSGTTVRALLVSSLDAPCGVYANSDPQPVKLRILDDGHLPKSVEAKLKGGLIIASAYGDLSNERVYMRIERLTKVEANGEFVETDVTGFISGEDGKYGVRGCVVDKASKLVKNAAYSGFLSGISQFFTTSLVAEQFNSCCGYPAGLQLLQDSSLQGASNAFDMMADYYIEKAEQIKPVIQIAAGRIVDITFTHKAELGDLYTKEKVRAIRDRNRDINES